MGKYLFFAVSLLFFASCSLNNTNRNEPIPVSYGKVIQASPAQIDDEPAVSYLIRRNSGSTFKLISEKQGIPEGSCVAITHVEEKT